MEVINLSTVSEHIINISNPFPQVSKISPGLIMNASKTFATENLKTMDPVRDHSVKNR